MCVTETKTIGEERGNGKSDIQMASFKCLNNMPHPNPLNSSRVAWTCGSNPVQQLLEVNNHLNHLSSSGN